MTLDVAVDATIGIIAQKLAHELAGHDDAVWNRGARATLAETLSAKNSLHKVIGRTEHGGDKVVQGHRAEDWAWLMCWRSPTQSRPMICLFLFRKTRTCRYLAITALDRRVGIL